MNSYNGFSGAQRLRVQAFLNAEVAAGRVPAPSRCCACGQSAGRIDQHLENYDDPLSYVELCVRCHFVLHGRFHNPDIWEAYRAVIRDGGRYIPLWSKMPQVLVAQHRPMTNSAGRVGLPIQPVYYDPPARRYLDEIAAADAASGRVSA